MSDRYKGAILSPTAPTVIPQSAGGIYTTSQQFQYQGQGVWPSAVNYPINNSLRFRASASAYLNRTPASAGNRQIFTWSGWVKKAVVGSSTNNVLFCSTDNSTGTGWLHFNTGNYGSADTLTFEDQASSTALVTTQVFRDVSAWYHIVLAVDTTQATNTNRIKLYVNGLQITAFSTSTYPSQNANTNFNRTSFVNSIGCYFTGTSSFFDGYLAEVNFIDGQALTPSSFGTTDAYGIWQPIPYTGTYGTNGFYLKFTDNSALTTSSNVGLGKDFSGNGNYWVTNNISITAGSTYDSMTDVPTNTNSNTANYCVLNPLDSAGGGTISEANLKLVGSGSTWRIQPSTIAVSNGKYYFEVVQTGYAGTSTFACGLVPVPTPSLNYLNLPSSVSGSAGWSFQLDNASTLYFWYAYSGSAQYVTISTSFNIGDVAQIAFDLNSGTIWVGKNNTWYNSSGGTTGNPSTGANPTATNLSGTVTPFLGAYGSTSNGAINCGQRPFSYTPPTGFYPLNTYNLPTPTILAGDDYFNTVLYTGTGSTPNAVTGVGFQPDFLWIKSRSNAYSHLLANAITGASKTLQTDSTAAEQTYGCINSFDSDGFTVDTDGTIGANNSGSTFVAWNWKANGSGSSNTQGTITSTVSANTTAGFSIVTYTGTGSNATVGHGLGVAPSMVIVKRRDTTAPWNVWHTSLTSGTYFVVLNTTAAQASGATRFTATPTSIVINIGTDGDVNGSGGTYVAYCFAQIAGYSAFGSYTGNGSSDGPFVYTGFRPRYILFKRTDSTGSWFIRDTARDPYNAGLNYLTANTANAEQNTGGDIDYLSNGFKWRVSSAEVNASGGTFIYMAFAENPFKISRAR